MTTFMIGADPEVFVRNTATKSHVTAHDLIPGDKAKPFKVDGGAIQVDGMALEFNIEPVPSSDFETFNNRIVGVMSQMRDKLKESGADLGFDISPSVQFDKDYYDGVPASAKELGCDPDFCAYSDDHFAPNKRPDGDSGLRSAAGHIHVGWGDGIPSDNPEHVDICRSFVRNLDVFVGLGMTCIDGDNRRRELYGKAGAYRPKPYGVEYRTPSNAWLRSKTARRFVHGLVTKAIADMQTKKPAFVKMAEDGIDVASIINSGDKVSAKSVLETYFYVRIPAGLEA